MESRVAPSDLSAGDRWRQSLLESAIPQSILDLDPEPGFTPLTPERFRWRPDEDAGKPLRPSRRRALEALPDRGSVLDVGVGGGASSLGLAAKAGLIVGVDPLESMLKAFEASALEAGVAARAVLGHWPDVADQVEPADIAVCHHAMYRTAEIEDFVTALTNRARHRVVIELSEHPPGTDFNPLWKTLHDLDRRDRQVADEAEAVLLSMGLAVEREDIVLPPGPPQEVTPDAVAFARRRLYVGPDRDPEIEEFLRTRERREWRVAAMWWPGAA